MSLDSLKTLREQIAKSIQGAEVEHNGPVRPLSAGDVAARKRLLEKIERDIRRLEKL